jgi:hypothetical protein
VTVRSATVVLDAPKWIAAIPGDANAAAANTTLATRNGAAMWVRRFLAMREAAEHSGEA